MIHPRHLIHLALVAALLLVGPTALAGPGNGKDHCGAQNGTRPGNGHGSKCSSEEESSTEEPSQDAEGEGSENEHPQGGPPGQDDEETKNNSPQAQPSPQPTSSPTQPSDPDTALVTVSVNRSVAQVGHTLTYKITVTNPGSAPVSPTITNTIPAEVQFLSATGLPAPSFGSGALTWTPTDLAPGATRTLTWQGRVTEAGDLDATNLVTATGANSAPVETHTYLAQVKGVVLHRSPEEPDWGTHKEKKVVLSTEERSATAPSDVASQSANPLPYTGAPVIPLIVLAALLLLGGCMLMTQRGRRFSAVGLMVVLVAAACTSEAPPRDQATESDANDEGDQVLGTRVSRGDGNGTDDAPAAADDSNPDDNNADDSNPDGEANGEATGDTDPDATADDEPAALPADPAPAAEPGEVITRDVVLVEVPNEPPAAFSLEPSSADNEISLDWDAASRSISGASSRAIFRADSPIQFLTSLRDGGGGISAEVTIRNVTDAERLLVDGSFVLTITGSAGSIELTSPRFQQVLDPDDEVAAGFEFALPSGRYEIFATYVTP